MKKLTIKTPAHFSFTQNLSFLDRGYKECLYTVDKKSVTRLVKIDTSLVLIRVSSTSDNDKLVISVKNTKSNADIQCKIEDYIVDWFDLNRDLKPFYSLLKIHPQTKRFPVKYKGLRLMGIVDLFEALCWCVIGQQINLTFAHKIKKRLVHRYGDKVIEGKNTHYCFPSPRTLLKANREELVKMKFSKQKINYIYTISEAFCSGELNRDELLKLPKSEQMNRLLAIKGIGPWTANYVSMKSLRDMTCIAYGDTGLSSALHKHFATEKKPSKATIDRIFQSFSGWESYLNFYLWRSLSD